MGVSKVVYGDNTLVDLTGDTVTPETMLMGVTAHGADGEEVVGVLSVATSSSDGLLSASDKQKLDGIEDEAQKNVQSDWNASSGDAFIKNKPSAFPPSTHNHTKSEITDFPTSMPPTSHNHSAANITSGTLAVARGGTGQTTVQALRNSMGLGNTTGVLPVANGGTGASTLAPAVGTKGARQIYAGTGDMTAGTTALTTGVIYLVYE